MKKLTRSREHKVFGGVLGGLGEYFNLDPLILRLLFVVLVLATGIFPGVILYLLVILFVPYGTHITPSKPADEGAVHDAGQI
jgi:phage shock protein C